MKLLLVIDYSSIEQLQEQLNHNVINDRVCHLLDRVEQCEPGVLWDDQGVLIATVADSVEVSFAHKAPAEPVLESVATAQSTAIATVTEA